MHAVATATIAALRPGEIREPQVLRPLLSGYAHMDTGLYPIALEMSCEHSRIPSWGQRRPLTDVHLKMWSRSRKGIRHREQNSGAYCRRFATPGNRSQEGAYLVDEGR